MKFTTKGNNSWLYNKAYYHGFNWQQKDKEEYAPDFFKDRLADLADVELVKKLPVKEELKLLLLKTIYPGLVTGVGIKHETKSKGEHKLGFEFDYTTGMPVIRGHSIKGAIRSAFPQAQNEDSKYKKEKAFHIHCLIKEEKPTKELFENFTDENYKKICLLEAEIFDGKLINDKRLSLYERDVFYDAYIYEPNEQGKYLADDSITPHMPDLLKNPVPVSFLKILPEVTWAFYFDLKNSQTNETLTSDKKYKLFKQILLHFGLGAKTNVGYGQFVEAKIKVKNQEEYKDNITDTTIYKKDKSGGYEARLTKITTEQPIYYKFEIDNKSGKGNDIFYKQESYFIKKFTKKGKTEEEYMANRPTIGDIFILTINNETPFQYSLKPKK